MKKKLAMLCLAGVMVFGMTACGDKSASTVNESVSSEELSTSEEENQTEAEDSTEASSENESKADEPRVSEREDYVGLQDLNIDEYVKLADYKNMTVTAEKPEVTDELIENYINSELLVGTVTDRAVKDGDIANIDYVGKKDDVAFEGGTGSGFDLEIGSGTFIPGFEEALVGVMPGETVDIDLAFPEDYPSEDLAGQAVVFTVTVNSITGKAEYATVTEEQLKSLGVDFTNKDELWEAGKKELEKQAELAYETNVNNAIMQKLYEDNVIETVPEYLVEEEIQNYNTYMEKLCTQMYGTDLETYVTTYGGITMDEYNSQLKTMSETIVKQYLIMESVFRAEKMELTDEMIKERATEEAPSYNMATGEALIEDVGYTAYRMYMVQEMVLERLNEMVTVEEPVAEE